MMTLMLNFARTADKAITAGREEYARLRRAGSSPTIPAVQVAVLRSVAEYRPELKGHALLTPGLRSSLTGSLAHLAYNIAAADSGAALV